MGPVKFGGLALASSLLFQLLPQAPYYHTQINTRVQLKVMVGRNWYQESTIRTYWVGHNSIWMKLLKLLPMPK